MKISNVLKLYVYQVFSYAFFDRAIFTIYLSERGVSLAQIGLLQGILWISTFVAEVPMGLLGDRIGRKPLIIFGRASIVVYSVLMAVGGPLWLFVLAFLLFGLGEAAISGADVSLLYESARDEGHKGDFTKVAGRFRGLASASLSAAMLVGGFMQVVSWNLVFLSAAALHLVTIGIVLTVPDVRSDGDERTTFRGMATELTTALRADRNLIAFVLGASLVGSSFTTLIIYAPVLLTDRHFDTPAVSTIMTVAVGLGALASMTAWRIIRRTGDRLFFVLVPSACGVLMLALAETRWLLLAGLLLVLAFTHDLIEPVANRVLNDRVGDRIRASILSLYSATFSFISVILFPVAGWMADRYSFTAAVIVLGLLCLPAALLMSRGAVLPIAPQPAEQAPEPVPARDVAGHV
ncbi:MFS transporter [Nonomuraea sp. TT08I-71]|nr:MFS transporter [Nonomuraea sp. TT08I-71]